jgi:hypothetical protein
MRLQINLYTNGRIEMNGRTVFRIFAVLILAAILVGVGTYIYQMGVAQGLATSIPSQVQGNNPPTPYLYYPPFYRPWGFGFFPFGFIFPLFFGILIFFLISRALFGGWRRHGPGDWGGRYGRDPNDIPPMVEEWHRKMHESPSNPPSEQK